ncbi:LysR family transcriptional regulator [Arthrobacter castelli]|uniref:LysR family transcriptional regulator n=1 Tax=Arthrobacter castelli TaxID=271431 RepID=UPI00247FBBCF|nr:LysR family transcriptional regulator [Arthrobacter castelli]
MFDRELLRSLRAVVDLKTITAAADHLSLTPSAVSQQLAKLHRQVGAELLVRRGRYLRPTEAAKVLAQAATDMEVVDARARARLEELQGTPTGQVTVGAFPSACRGLIGPIVAEIAARYPKISLVVRETYPEEGVEKAVNGKVDIAVIHEWKRVSLTIPAALSTTVLGTDDVDLIVPSGHPATQRETITVADLPAERWITDTTYIYARWLKQSLEAARIPYEMAGLVNEHESQVDLTAHGLGLSIVPRLGRSPLPHGVETVTLSDDVPRRRLMRVERIDSIDRPALSAVRQVIDEQAQTILGQMRRTALPNQDSPDIQPAAAQENDASKP